MKYIKLTDDKWVEVDEDRDSAKIVVKSDIVSRVAEIDKLAKDSSILTDKQLIAWAKENYPMSPDYREVERLTAEKSTLETLLANLE